MPFVNFLVSNTDISRQNTEYMMYYVQAINVVNNKISYDDGILIKDLLNENVESNGFDNDLLIDYYENSNISLNKQSLC